MRDRHCSIALSTKVAGSSSVPTSNRNVLLWLKVFSGKVFGFILRLLSYFFLNPEGVAKLSLRRKETLY
jgi:hypothetical protein